MVHSKLADELRDYAAQGIALAIKKDIEEKLPEEETWESASDEQLQKALDVTVESIEEKLE